MRKKVKSKKQVSSTALYVISAAIVLFIIIVGVSQPQNTTTQAQMAQLTPPVPSVNPTISGPAFGCLGGTCPMQITPVVSQVVVSPAANAPIPVVSGTAPSAAPGAANPVNPADPAAQQPAGNPLQFLANPNGKVPPGRAKHFFEQLFAFFVQLLGGGNNQQGGNQQGGAGGAQQAAPANNPNANNANPANGAPIKPGYGNNPGSTNPGGHVVNPGHGQDIQQQQQQDQPGAANGQNATGAGAAVPATNGAQANGANGNGGNVLQNIMNLFKQLLGGK
jgi:hypothetical protein